MKEKKNHQNTTNEKKQVFLKGDITKDKPVTEHPDAEKEKIAKKDKDIEELEEKASKYEKLWDKYIRICADFDNARKRWEKEKQELIKFANYTIIKELITIMDELEQAIKAVKQHSQIQDIQKGIELTYNNLYSILRKEGLTPIEAKGKKFDPHFHEIVGQKEEKELDEHTVIEEVQKGYNLGDRLLRTSKVIISVLPSQIESNNKKEDIKEKDGNAIDEK